MKAQLTKIHEIMHGHSERALVHGIGPDGLSIKIEVPDAEARGMSVGQMLWIAWNVDSMPFEAAREAPPAAAAEPSLQGTSSPPGASPREIDELFVSLMNRGGRATTPPPTTSTATESAASLAARLGLTPK